ncbi:MAG TPA: LPS export ABC transporter periplasmic protein LptC, partial [Candidatus Cloacimonadota bacterium]|nr:LPS export ABC transporter periplasmic protein LptC [Candidatus Cloacimonadota bacterium]
YDPAGRVRSTMKADSTIVDDARNIIYTNGNVLMKSENGSISTRRIIWDRNLDEIVAPERVVLTRDGSVLKGTNLRTNSTISFAELEAVEAEGLFDEKDLDW